jgi:hypothetical protein
MAPTFFDSTTRSSIITADTITFATERRLAQLI